MSETTVRLTEDQNPSQAVGKRPAISPVLTGTVSEPINSLVDQCSVLRYDIFWRLVHLICPATRVQSPSLFFALRCFEGRHS